jgi:hypothetical protein
VCWETEKKNFATDAAKFCAPHVSCGEALNFRETLRTEERFYLFLLQTHLRRRFDDNLGTSTPLEGKKLSMEFLDITCCMSNLAATRTLRLQTQVFIPVVLCLPPRRKQRRFTDEIQIYLILLQDSLIVQVPRGPSLVDQEHSPLLTNVTPCPCKDIPNPMREATGTAAISVDELGTTMQVYGV